MNALHTASARPCGFTLVELLVTVSVVAILATLAGAAFTGFLDRYRLSGAVETLFSDLQLARSEAVKRNRSVQVVVTSGVSWAYTLSELNGVCDGSTPLTATQLKRVEVGVAGFTGTRIDRLVLNSGGGGTTMVFQPDSNRVRVACDSTTLLPTGSVISFRSADGKQACLLLNGIGRIKRCSPSGANHLIGFPECACP
jgi:prepilin-type N-terminal cleavage/methylation domain-containing protein